MSKAKKGVKLIVTIIFIMLLIFIICWLTKSEAERMVLSCHKYYRKSMNLHYVGLDKKDKKIKISFKLNGMWTEEDVAETYEAIINKFYGEDKGKYNKYVMKISFVHLEEEIVISNISESQDSIMFHTYECRIAMKDIADLFPFISKLHLCPAYYDDISEINGLTNLTYLFFSQGVTTAEERYILSHYPNCEVDAQGDNSMTR